MTKYLTILFFVGLINLALIADGVLLTLTYITFGLVYVFAMFVANVFAIMLVLLPAFWVGKNKSELGGLVFGIASLALVVFGPGLLRETLRESEPLLQPPLAPVSIAVPRSVDMMVSRGGRDYRPCMDTCLNLLQNPSLEWIRLRFYDDRVKLYVREGNIMVLSPDHNQTADLQISNFSDYPHFAGFGVWAAKRRPTGYIIVDNRTNEVIARNITVKMQAVGAVTTVV